MVEAVTTWLFFYLFCPSVTSPAPAGSGLVDLLGVAGGVVCLLTVGVL